MSWYRSQLAFVGQEPVLFNMSIADNILYGAQGVSKEDIEKAARQVRFSILSLVKMRLFAVTTTNFVPSSPFCRKANAHDFICGFPEGYDTVVGSGGSQLSGYVPLRETCVPGYCFIVCLNFLTPFWNSTEARNRGWPLLARWSEGPASLSSTRRRVHWTTKVNPSFRKQSTS